MKTYLTGLLCILIHLPSNSQPTKVCLSNEQAQVIWRDLERIPLLIEERANLEHQVQSLERENTLLQTAAQAAQDEARAQRVISGLRAEQIEACDHAKLEQEKTARARLWKTRAVAAGGWVLAGVFAVLALDN